jgi:Outer membrane lipoprotein-sorting protein
MYIFWDQSVPTYSVTKVVTINQPVAISGVIYSPANGPDYPRSKTAGRKLRCRSAVARACRWCAALACCVVSLEILGADLSAITVPEVKACVERAMPRDSMRQELTLSVIDNSASARDISGKLDWKRFANGLAKVYFRIEDSPQYEGVAVLMAERSDGEPDITLYSPALRSDRRIAGTALAGPLLGTDFSYEDFALLQNLVANGAMKRLDDREFLATMESSIRSCLSRGLKCDLWEIIGCPITG